MKNFLVVFPILLLSMTANAQKIHFTDSANQWTWYMYDCPNGTASPISPMQYNGYFSGDTIFTGRNYKKWVSNNSQFGSSFLLREDTTSQKVYLKHLSSSTPFIDTNDYLLYDYTLALNDTFHIGANGAPNFAAYYVDALDSTMINNTWHKVWHYQRIVGGGASKPDDYYVVEGIGSLYHPLCPFVFDNTDYCESITCFHHNGTTPPLSAMVGDYFNNTTSCTQAFMPAAVSNISNNSKAAALSPNPIDNTSKITLPYSIATGQITITNLLGQKVIDIPITNASELVIGDKIAAPGVYIYRVTDAKTGKVFSGKFVRQ